MTTVEGIQEAVAAQKSAIDAVKTLIEQIVQKVKADLSVGDPAEAQHFLNQVSALADAFAASIADEGKPEAPQQQPPKQPKPDDEEQGDEDEEEEDEEEAHAARPRKPKRHKR